MNLQEKIRRILREEDESQSKKEMMFRKVANLVKDNPPYVHNLKSIGFEGEEIIEIIELILGTKIVRENLLYDDYDTYYFPENKIKLPYWIYYESQDGEDWVIRYMNDNGDIIGYRDVEGTRMKKGRYEP